MSERQDIDKRTVDVECALCGTGAVDLSLTDGRSVHRSCVELIRKYVELQEKLKRGRENLRRAQWRSRSLSGVLAAFFGDKRPVDDVRLSERVLTDLEVDQKGLDSEMAGIPPSFKSKSSLEGLYDYWPDYPPDWDDRRWHLRELRKHICERCRGGVGVLQAHHKVPFWKGGSNKPENLELLCIKCHGKEHGRDFVREGFSKHQKKVSDTEELIAKAMLEGKKITFLYYKWDEDAGRPTKKGQRRTIKPARFVDVQSSRKGKSTRCVEGLCDLRRASRVFNVKRMHKIELKK